jgi:hypothetical protein
VIVKEDLLADLKPQVRRLETDLRVRSEEAEFGPGLHEEWQAAHDAERTAASYETWLDGEITQAAVAWVLGTVFLRFCEDNELIDVPYLAGPGERLAVAADRQQAFFEENPHLTDRDWIIAGFRDMSDASPVAAGLFDRDHNPMWRITPSHEAAKAVLAFWRTRGETQDAPVSHDFTDPAWDTRFLGDLYQDLSDHAKKTYALLQTPEFVEEFILDLTLKPAIDDFGLAPDPPRARPDLPRRLRFIDPACGSGHFLLGAFAVLLDRWAKQAPGTDPWVLIRRVLEGLHGADKNPFAASITRFRLLLAAMKAGGVQRLAEAPEFVINVAVGDSLIHGRGAPGRQGELFPTEEVHTYRTEDVAGYIKDVDLLGANSYHVVVGNPPYITVKDPAENQQYRDRYATCAGTYALSVPFAERFFNLAVVAGGDRRGAGYVGQITANSFMKREFGKKLIEDFFRLKVELTHVIDTSGAYIPGHGTPTVILAGRNLIPRDNSIRAVLGVRGEPTQPDPPEKGPVWQAIINQIDTPGHESDWVSVTDLPRDRLAKHPWTLSGGGAGALRQAIEACTASLGSRVSEIGFGAVTRADNAYMLGAGALRRAHISNEYQKPLVEGGEIRDWEIRDPVTSLWPYDSRYLTASWDTHTESALWQNKILLRERIAYGKTQLERGLTWFEYSMFFRERYRSVLSIAFAFVATHNHFVLSRGGKVFKQTAPVIKLPEETSEDDHLALLGLLNSSTACFWAKTTFFDRGNGGYGGGIASEDWERFYEFDSTKLGRFPLPVVLPLDFGRALDTLGQRLTGLQPSAVCAARIPTRNRLDEARVEYAHIRRQIISLQEELDWEVYHLYGLLTEQESAGLRADPDDLPEVRLGERAFEIVLARRCAAGEFDTQWFARHASTPITEIPAHWPETYRQVVQRRIDVIGRRRDIALIERPECKRRWSAEPWEKKEHSALRAWLLDRCERRDLWFATGDMSGEEPRPMTTSRLADRLRDDADFVSVGRLYAGPDADLADVVAEITDAEHVPYLAALRYKDTGLRKHAQWEQTWDLQRQEDATGERLNIPVPPKYTSADFRKTSYWSNRGKLDVSKERFISYPLASPDGDGSLLLGWAGWDHREQAHALMTVIEDRSTRDGWACGQLLPLIAGLAEVMPWVRQWHREVDPAFGMSPADAYDSYLEDQQRRCGASGADLAVWRPPPSGRGRRPRTEPAAAVQHSPGDSAPSTPRRGKA